jgi:hypothetical protein
MLSASEREELRRRIDAARRAGVGTTCPRGFGSTSGYRRDCKDATNASRRERRQRAAVGLTAERPMWTREGALAAVQAFHALHGYQPISKEAGAENKLPSWHVAKRLFGSWNAMIEAAGFRSYPARSSANAKALAFRDRNPGWRERLSENARACRLEAA